MVGDKVLDVKKSGQSGEGDNVSIYTLLCVYCRGGDTVLLKYTLIV